MSLTFDDYMKQTRKTAIYPGSGTGSTLALAYVGLGLGEVGEVQGKLKKVIRDSGGEVTAEHADAIAKELGDCLWYIGRLADELDLSLDAIAEGNLKKLHDRAQRGTLQGSGDNR